MGTSGMRCVILVAVACHFACLSSAAPGFGQGHLYDIVITVATLEFKHAKYIGKDAHMSVSRRSRGGTPTLSASIPIVQDLPVHMNSSWTAYQKYSNKWRESIIKGFINFCDLLESKVKEYRVFYNYSNFPYKCPVVKGNYSINEFRFEHKDLPPVVPGNEWKLRIGWYLGDEVIFRWYYEFKIDRTKEMRARKERPGGKH